MARFEINKLPKKQRVKIIGELYDALGIIKDREEARSVFRDLFTVSEIAMMSRRIQVAFLIKEGYSYEDISNILSVSRSTIERINHKLKQHGQGFEIMYRNFKKLQQQRQKEKTGKKEFSLPASISEAAQVAPPFTVLDLISWIKQRNQKKDED